MGQQGYALTEKVETEIVSAYAAGAGEVPAVAAAPGWFVRGSFYLPKSLAKTQLEAIGCVSATGLVGTVRLYDPTTGVDAPVSGSDVSLTGTSLARALSGTFELTGNRTYLVLVQFVGAVGDDKFGTLGTASLVGP